MAFRYMAATVTVCSRQIKKEVSEARLEAEQLKMSQEQTEFELSQMKEIRYDLERVRPSS